MIVQLQVKDTQSEFLLNLFNQLKSSIENIRIIEPISNTEKLFDNMTDKERWERYGDWDPDTDENFKMAQHRYIFESLEKEYGSEDYEAWQK